MLSAEGRRTIPITLLNGREFVALDELAPVFQLTVRQESGAVTVSRQDQTVILTPDETLASVAGRLISLNAAPTRVSGRVMVPLDFISRALTPIYNARVDLRAATHVLILGDLRVPRVTIRYEPSGNQARLTIDATPRASSTVAEDADRLTVKFDADAIDVAIPSIQPQGVVRGLRTLDPVTIAIDLGTRIAGHRASTETLQNTTRLVVDLVAASTSAAPPATAPPPAPALPPALPTDRPVLGQPSPAIRTIVVDPGHGGGDTGVHGPGGTLEKDLTLAVARRLKGALEDRLGIRVLLTRDDDRDVPLDRRTAVANNNKADVFISLHANGSPLEAAAGLNIYIASFDDEERAHASMTSERMPVAGGGARDIELVRWDLAQVRHLDRSVVLATTLEQQLRIHVQLDVQPVERERFRVLESANMPAAVVELGYLTNPGEERTLARGEVQTALADAMLEAIVRFRDLLGSNGGEP